MAEEQLKRCLSQEAQNPRVWVVYNDQPTTQAGLSSQSAFSVTDPVPSPVNPPVLPEKLPQNATENFSSKKHKTLCRHDLMFYSNVFQKG